MVPSACFRTPFRSSQRLAWIVSLTSSSFGCLAAGGPPLGCVSPLPFDAPWEQAGLSPKGGASSGSWLVAEGGGVQTLLPSGCHDLVSSSHHWICLQSGFRSCTTSWYFVAYLRRQATNSKTRSESSGSSCSHACCASRLLRLITASPVSSSGHRTSQFV